MNLAEATRRIRALRFQPDNYAVFGSGPLLVRGIIPEVNDIDIVSRSRAWEQAQSIGALVHLPEHDITVASFFAGTVTVGTSWAIGNVDIDDAIETAELIDGIPWVRLDLVVAYKELAGRPKDIEHLRLLRAWQKSEHL